ncbi:protein kinase [Streptomyces sp. NPDC088387]|uniref:serine/threonine-protein kinase n=1 Tax=Streptomyces sp. NPDC088387 TaxID=3365859 RepID=UPI00381F77B5
MRHATEAFQPLQADDPRQVAGYRLAARLGAGGMGRVYLSHTQGGRPVAIKVVRPELADDADFRRRFRREITAAQRVRGAYTAELIDADADGTPPWLATLYVPGPALSEAVARRGPLPVPAVLWLTAGIAEALQAVHGAGIVHRDLKPSNVLLASDGPRVIDFGISMAADVSSHTATGATLGTPQYMAPEQATAGEVTAATDVFALAQTAAFALLGRPLYGDGPSATVLYRIVHTRPDLSGLPDGLRPLIARCLAHDPAERATLTDIVEWCRDQLGTDARPTAWPEITGPERSVPAPVASTPAPDVTPADAPTVAEARTTPQNRVPAHNRTLAHTAPLIAPTHRPVAVARPARRRRTALVTAALVTAGVVLVGGLAWTTRDGWVPDGGGDRGGAAAGSAGPKASASNGSDGSDAAEGGGARDGASAAGGQQSEDASGVDGAGTGSRAPRPEDHAQMRLDEGNSLSFSSPDQRKDRTGDIRFTCENLGCALESDTSTITQMMGAQGTTLDECRIIMEGATAHTFPLSAAAAGSEFCVQHRNGDMALLVVQVKNTALWDIKGSSFLLLDMTIWRDAVRS